MRKLKKIIKSFTQKLLIQYLKNIFRPSSYPYLTGDTLRKHSDQIHDETSKLDPGKIKKGDLVFVKTDFLIDYFENIHPKIKYRYYLLTHNSDFEITKEYKKYCDEKIIIWYAQNLNFEMNHSIQPIPIGLENKRFLKGGLISHYKGTNAIEKNKFVYSCFNESTHKDRIGINNLYQDNKLVTICKGTNHKRYIQNLSEFKFNLCPRGNGLDTHRIWESLMVKSVPILLKNKFSENFINLGLPFLLLDEWEELNAYNEEELDSIYKKLKPVFEKEYFNHLNYWTKQEFI